MTEVSIAKAKTHFDELVMRAAKGEHIVIRQRDRAIAALISATDLGRLEQLAHDSRQAALDLGQHAELLKQIEAGKLHPVMAAFGLWRDETELADLTEQIYASRKLQPPRAEVHL
jgi:prevent-host-death family protein